MEIKLEDDAAYRAEVAKLADVQHRLSAADQRVQNLLGNLSSKGAGAKRDPLTLEAEAVLAGGETSRADDLRREAIQKDMVQAVHDREVLRRAVEIQRRTADEEGARASRRACEKIGPKHREIVRKLFAAVVPLGRAAIAEIDLRDALRQGGISFAGFLPPLGFSALGDPRDCNSRIALWLVEVVLAGFAEPHEIPSDFQAGWPKDLLACKLRDARTLASTFPAKPPAPRPDPDGWAMSGGVR